MVNEDGQLYTIEAISAGILMLVTVYLVLNSTSLYTPGDSHINDMQLKQIGNDGLAVMDTPEVNATNLSSLSRHLSSNLSSTSNSAAFYSELRQTLDHTTENSDNIRLNATVFYRKEAGAPVGSFTIPGGDAYYRENSVVSHRWVYTVYPQSFGDTRNQTVLLEVQIWRP
jgi:hypothetical protein